MNSWLLALIISLLGFSSVTSATSIDLEEGSESDTNYYDSYGTKKSDNVGEVKKPKSKKQLKERRQRGERSDKGPPFPESDLEDDLK